MDKLNDTYELTPNPVPEPDPLPAPVPPHADYFPIDLIAIIAALSLARGTFWQKIASPRFILSIVTQIPTIVLWINGNVPGKYAVIICAVLTAVYTISETYVHVESVKAAANVTQDHLTAVRYH